MTKTAVLKVEVDAEHVCVDLWRFLASDMAGREFNFDLEFAF